MTKFKMQGISCDHNAFIVATQCGIQNISKAYGENKGGQFQGHAHSFPTFRNISHIHT
jgi:hypothetical protein